MRFVFQLVLLTFAAAAGADDFPPIDSLCSGPRCTDTMRAVVADYEASPAFWSLDELPQVASGSCHHIHANLDPLHEHHGLFLFDVVGGQPGFNGVFSFFAPKNPYTGISVDQARHRLYGNGDPRITPLLLEAQQGKGFILSQTAKFYYWFRINPGTRELYQLSLWAFNEGGVTQRAFCRFQY